MSPKLQYLALPLCLTAAVSADPAKDDIGNAPKQGLSALSVLPTGSILKKVKVPRYNKDLKPISLILADRVKVESKTLVTAKNLKLRQLDLTGKDKLKVTLATAKYHSEKEIITSDNPLKITTGELTTTAQSMIIHWQTKRGYLFGPVHTTYIIPPKTTMNSIKSSATPLLIGSLLTTGYCAEPAALSPAKIQELERAKNAPTLKVLTAQDEEKANLLATQARIDKSEAKAFLQTFAPEKISVTETQQKENDKPPVIEKGDKANQLDVTCDGGMFFDAENGLLNYQKNVKIQEPRFKMSCSKELKVFLVKAAAKADPKIAKEKVNKVNPKGIEKILAVGNVAIQGSEINAKGIKRTIKASAELAEYDYPMGTIILKGGYPVIHSTENGRTLTFTAQEKNLWIKIEKDGSFKTAKGKWHQRVSGLKETKKP